MTTHMASGLPRAAAKDVAPASSPARSVKAARAASWLQWAPALVLGALVLGFAAANPKFMTLANFARIAISAAPALMVAVGVTFIIVMGSIDLSMEGTISTAAVLFALTFKFLGGEMAGWGWLAIPAALAVGASIGLVNGLVHVKLSIPSFMSSLAIGFVGMGLSVVLTGGDILRVDDDVFRALIYLRIGGFPLMVFVAIALVFVAWFIQRKTILGRHFYAVGGGEDLAHASGLNVKRVRILGFMLAGVFYALAAIFAVARGGMAESLTGSNFMFASITAVVIGGTSLMGGSGGVWNAVVGVLIVSVINNGMVVVGLPNYLQDGVLGALVILSVALAVNRKNQSLVK
ncbi:ABC transporter permease [Variovorax sp. dw_954]|uniref:ABC transporter permease n=1 Tax=Variovorax sp. dw_954 TaxID=2720078 RepID=UPI0031F6DD8C